MREIQDVIKAEVKKYLPRNPIICEVVSYEDGLCEVNPLDESGNILGVKIQAEEDGIKGFVCVPKVGSTVIVSFIDENEPFISMFSRIDSVILISAQYGSIKAEELQTQLYKMQAQLDACVVSLRDWVVVPSDGGAALKTHFAAQIAGRLRPDFDEIINTKVKHGA